MNLIKNLPSDEVVICDSNNNCIEARGENARMLVGGILLLLICTAAYYLSKIK